MTCGVRLRRWIVSARRFAADMASSTLPSPPFMSFETPNEVRDRYLRRSPELVGDLRSVRVARSGDRATTGEVFDCLYVALAERESCKLVTADHRPTLARVYKTALRPSESSSHIFSTFSFACV